MSTDLYQDAIMALAKDVSAAGRLDAPDHSATIDNPLCGDRVTIDLKTNQDGTIAALRHHVRGCALCKASAALLSKEGTSLKSTQLNAATTNLEAFLKGTEELEGDFPGLEAFEPVKGHKSRHDCILLPFRAAIVALENKN